MHWTDQVMWWLMISHFFKQPSDCMREFTSLLYNSKQYPSIRCFKWELIRFYRCHCYYRFCLLTWFFIECLIVSGFLHLRSSLSLRGNLMYRDDNGLKTAHDNAEFKKPVVAGPHSCYWASDPNQQIKETIRAELNETWVKHPHKNVVNVKTQKIAIRMHTLISFVFKLKASSCFNRKQVELHTRA